MLGAILLIVLVPVAIGTMPVWPHSRTWSYYPSGGLGLMALLVLVLMMYGRA